MFFQDKVSSLVIAAEELAALSKDMVVKQTCANGPQKINGLSVLN